MKRTRHTGRRRHTRRLTLRDLKPIGELVRMLVPRLYEQYELRTTVWPPHPGTESISREIDPHAPPPAGPAMDWR